MRFTKERVDQSVDELYTASGYDVKIKLYYSYYSTVCIYCATQIEFKKLFKFKQLTNCLFCYSM